MRLLKPEITLENGEVVVSAGVLYDHRPLNKPERAWFALPERYAGVITRRADAFTAGLIVLAMRLREDLVVEGGLSPRLLEGLEAYQGILQGWFPEHLNRVRIEARSLCELPAGQAGQAAVTLFSGGVDSAYTLFSHLPDRQPPPEHPVRHALFIHGYDVPLQNPASYEKASRAFAQELATAGVELVPVRSNLRYFTSGLLPWMIAHGCATIAAGLAIDGLCARLLVPASHTLHDMRPWGSSPLVDHLLSTGRLEVVHHGEDAARIHKVATIGDWAPAQRTLRVCINEDGRDGIHNCSRCEKCTRTMAMLLLTGKLEQFTTFHRPFRRWDIARWTPNYASGVVHTPYMRAYAKETGRRAFLLPLAIAHLRGLVMARLRRLTPRRLFAFLKRRKFPYQQDPFNPRHLNSPEN